MYIYIFKNTDTDSDSPPGKAHTRPSIYIDGVRSFRRNIDGKHRHRHRLRLTSRESTHEAINLH
jgi:hypothetical protein